MSAQVTSYSATTARRSGDDLPHVCNCIGCCERCGTCRTWPGHTRRYCDLLVAQAEERRALVLREKIEPSWSGSDDWH